MLKKSGKIALSTTIGLFIFMTYLASCFAFNIDNVRSYVAGSGTKFFENIRLIPGTGTDEFVIAVGTQSQGQSGTSALTVDITSNPRISITTSGGSTSANFVDFPLQQNGVAVGTMSMSTGDARYILQQQGTGTGNTLSNLTIDGAGTNSATMAFSGTIIASGNNISSTEISYLDSLTGNINTFQSSHAHGGTDSTQINHDNVTGTGTNSHPTIDTFIASKASANGLASLDSNSLVVQNPASGSTTASANNIPIADGSGLIADDWMSTTITKLGATIELGAETTGDTDDVNEGGANLYYTETRVNANRGSATLSEIGDVTITSVQDGHKLSYNDASGDWINATDTAIVDWSGITGVPTDNGSISTTASAGFIPVAGADGTLEDGWTAKDVLRLPGTTTAQTGLSDDAQVYNYESIAQYDDAFLRLKMENAGTTNFVDSSLNNHPVTAVDNAIGTSTTILSGDSYLGDGTSDLLQIDDHSGFAYGTNNFTIGLTVRFNSLQSEQTLFYLQSSDGQFSGSDSFQFYFVESSNRIAFYIKEGGVTKVEYKCSANLAIDTTYHFELVRDGSNIYIFKDGSPQTLTEYTAIGSYSIPDIAGDIKIGGIDNNSTTVVDGYIDGVYVYNDEALHTGTFTPPTNDSAPLGSGGGIYTQHQTRIKAPGTSTSTDPLFIVQSQGTITAEPTYILNNASTTVFGMGTTTDVEGTDTSYAGWFDGAVRATAFNVASQKKIKENIKKIHIGKPKTEAEAIAKKNYIKNNKSPWFTANEENYTYVGSDSATYVDYETMEEDYQTYIELEWASDGSQTDYIKAVEDESKKEFWRTFDSIVPKSWNPKGKRNIERKGFVVEEAPKEILGDDGRTIDPMKIISYNALVQQELKKDNIRNMKTGLTSLQLLDTLVGTQTSSDYQVKEKIAELQNKITILEAK